MTTKKTKAALGSMQEKKELRIVFNDVSEQFPPNQKSVWLLADRLPLWMPANIFNMMTDALCGHSKGMAKVIAENLITFVSGGGRRLTGIQHVDEHLLFLYNVIYDYARENGCKLELLY